VGSAERGRQTLTVAGKKRANWKYEELNYDIIHDRYERGWAILEATPEKREQLRQRGEERGLMYMLLVTTGLRLGELASLTISSLVKDKDEWFLKLDPEFEKNGKGTSLPIRQALAERLIGFTATPFRLKDGPICSPEGVLNAI
jgi:integrase